MAKKVNKLSSKMRQHRILYLFGFSLLVFVLVFASGDIRNDFSSSINSVKSDYKVYQLKYAYARFSGLSESESLKSSLDVSYYQSLNSKPSADEFAQSVPVLLFHSVSSVKGPYTETSATFENQMFTLKKNGYTALTIAQYEGFIKGTYFPPAKSVLITFDDGTNTAYRVADPIFKAIGFHGVDFIITKYSIEKGGSVYYLSPNTISSMSNSGRWDIEAHTDAGHVPYQISSNGTQGDFYSNKLWIASLNRVESNGEFARRVSNDVSNAKSELKSVTGKEPTAFAYPYGDYGQNTVNYPGAQNVTLSDIQKNFSISMIQYYPGIGNSQEYFGDNTLLARRIEVPPTWTGPQLLADIELGNSKSQNYADNFSTNKGWRQVSGDISLKNNELNINSGSPEATTTPEAILDGGFYWSNYSFTANMHLISGTSFSLTARNFNSDNYAGCEFSESHIEVYQVLNNTRTILNEGTYLLDPTSQDNYGITVENNMIGCTIDGHTMAIATSNTIPRNGGIAIFADGPVIGGSSAVVTHVNVTSSGSSLDTSILNVDMKDYNNWQNLNYVTPVANSGCFQSRLSPEVQPNFYVCNNWSDNEDTSASNEFGSLVVSNAVGNYQGYINNVSGVQTSNPISEEFISGGSSSE